MRGITNLGTMSRIICQRYLSSTPVVSGMSVQKQMKFREKKDDDLSKRSAVEDFLLRSQKKPSEVDWKALAAENDATLVNVGNMVMASLIEKKDPALLPFAKDFVSKFTSVSVLSRYILIQETEDQILEMYEKIKTLVKGVWSLEIGERMAIALSRTSRWREISEIIESIKVGGNPSNATNSAYATAAFLNEDFDLGWKIAKKLRNPTTAMEAFLQKCPENYHKEEEGAKVLELFVDREVDMSLVKKLFDFYTKLGYDCKFSKRIWKSPVAFCSKCNREIKEELTQEEFSNLKTSFYNNVLKGGDVYMNSSPAELQSFLKFCEEKGPFEIVLDGLNAGLSPKGKTILTRMLEAFQSHKVLVIGRKHMDKQWKWLQLNRRGQPVEFYFLNDYSQDDVFMLYACFMSGPKTKVVTRDMLRDHLFRLGESEGATFRKWLRLNLLNAELVGKGSRVRVFGNEGRFLQWENGTGGHIPVKSVDEKEEVWACFTKSK